MAGRPLREAKRAAAEFLAASSAGTMGLVAFGHEAFALTAPGAPESDVERELASLVSDAETGTALYDAVGLSVAASSGCRTEPGSSSCSRTGATSAPRARSPRRSRTRSART